MLIWSTEILHDEDTRGVGGLNLFVVIEEGHIKWTQIQHSTEPRTRPLSTNTATHDLVLISEYKKKDGR